MIYIGDWTKTANGEDFLIVEHGEEDKIIIFATDTNMKLLCEAETIYIDGTLTCPRLFYQIFTMHAFKNGKQFPLVYCLLPNKTQATYVKTFELMKDKAVSLSVDPEIVLGDFEQAIKQAVDLCFLSAEFRGCYFHFSQALMRKFQAVGLQQVYRSDEEACRFLIRTAALAFVPVRFVRLAWQGVKASKPTHLPRIDEFVDYFQSTWITLRRTAALAIVPVRFVRLAWQGVKASKPTHLPRIDEFVDYFQSTWITLRRTAALAFVPVRFVRLAWQGVKASKPTHLPRIDEFVQSTWITGVFTLQHWNVYENDTYRTNNHESGWEATPKYL